MDRIEDCISFIAGKAAQQITRRARDLLAPYGVTPGQYAALKVISDGDGLTGAEIGARLLLDSASITGVVDRLEAVGLIRRKADAKDRRATRISLAPKARSLMPDLDAAMDRLNAEAADILSGPVATKTKGLRRLGQDRNWSTDV